MKNIISTRNGAAAGFQVTDVSNKEFNLMVSDSGYIENSGSIGKTVNAKTPKTDNEPNWDDVENDR